ncbi:hypothetical protein VCRA2123O443_10667 [Vibrio crassostreae]|nr:hypothetical protein EDB36_101146 [Vibrio crassostreae]CAK1825482.1 hypothetical protein VCRA2110O182_10152 [Vibrio crassostreae]CAK2300839.1 hypothetical protein VCRA2111O408_10720 [Vibrio crassostreae]CAK2301162.1 hypothetical protein VCRA211O406_10152 [Vibrio crassostreae]CAK3203649.1 hypothetical protein VCRA2123O443_10667 [Vibrio crassostreae]
MSWKATDKDFFLLANTEWGIYKLEVNCLDSKFNEIIWPSTTLIDKRTLRSYLPQQLVIGGVFQKTDPLNL